MLKITIDGGPDHLWIAEVFEDNVSVWHGHPKGKTAAAVARAALDAYEPIATAHEPTTPAPKPAARKKGAT